MNLIIHFYILNKIIMKNTTKKYIVKCDNKKQTNAVMQSHKIYKEYASNYWNYFEYIYTEEDRSPIVSNGIINYYFSSDENVKIISFKEWKDLQNKFDDKWCIKQNTHQDVCDWFNSTYSINTILDGSFKYLVNKKYNYFSEVIPEEHKEITLDEFRERVLNIEINKIEMKKQKLTRDQLLELRTQFDCNTWEKEINSILTTNIYTKGEVYEIPESSVQLLIDNGTEEQKQLVIKLGIELPKSNRKIYIENQDKSGLTVGDKVKVLRKAESNTNGWMNSWTSYMDENIGKILTITDIHDSGIALNNSTNDMYTYSYPYFVLEKVVEEYVPFTFEDDLLGKSIISKDKSCKRIITYQSKKYVANGYISINYQVLFDEYTFLDNTPCGKLK